MNNEIDKDQNHENLVEEDFKQADINGESDDFEILDDSQHSNSKIILASVLGVALLGVIGFAAWYFLLKGEEGNPVPAPRNVSFGNDSNSNDKLPAGEYKITLTDEQLHAANLKIVEVGETLDGVVASASTTGVVKANEYDETPVVSPVGGIVKRINVRLGQLVRRGQTVAVVSSDELAQTQSRYLSMKAELDEAQKRYKRALNLSEVSEESRNELDKTKANLRTAEAEHVRHLSHYQRTEKLVEIGATSRDEFEKVKAMHESAMARLEEAKSRFERAKELLKINPLRNNEIDQFLTKVRNMESEISSTREKLVVLGMPRARVNSLNSSRQITADLPIVSPITGSITERIVNQGEVVSTNSKLAQITDLSTVWVIGQVYEKDLGKLRVGSGTSVSVDAYPGELFRGNISYIDPNLDEKTRTAQVRIELPNPGERLKMGMYVSVAFARLGGSERTAPLVPKEAVQNIGNRSVVFAATDDPKTFLIKPIKIAQEKDKSYPVTEGIFVGDRVVTDGSFLLRAEWLKTNSNKL